jgi:uncharacterized glyoxalase superfamily protein PhnB
MTLQVIKPVLYTKNIKETVAFYTDVLGFKCAGCNNDWTWAAVSRDEIELMVALPNEHLPFEKPLFTGSFYINVEDVDAIWNELKDRTNICYPLETFDYGMREFAIYDNNGYLLQFGQPVNLP